MKGLPFWGCATALVTPMKHDKIDLNAFSKLIEFQIRNNVSAIVVCGTTGESPTLCEDEKLSLFRCAVEAADKRVKVIAGCGSPSTIFTASLAKKAEDTGVDGILTVTPYYNKGSDEGLFRHYKTVAESVSIPVIAYNVPSRTGVDIPLSVYEKMAQIPNISGIKEASGNVAKAEKIKSLFNDRFALYSGNDDLIAPIYSVGGNGVVSVISNILPRETAQLCSLCEKGDMKEASKLQLRMYPLINALFSQVNPIPVKTALNLMGMCSDEMRLPLCKMETNALENLKSTMADFGLI